MSLLEELKKQAEEKKTGQTIPPGQQSRPLQDRNVLVLAPKFNLVKKYLKELADNLNVVNPDTRFEFSLTRRVILKNFVKRNFRLEIVKDNKKSECILRYDLVQDREIKQLIDNLAEADLAKKVMAERNISYKSSVVGQRKVQIIVKPKITTSFSFSVDIEKCMIVLRLKNFDGTWDQIIQYPPNKVTEKLLDEMGKYILNQPNDFMAMSGNKLSDSMRGRLQARLKTDDRGSKERGETRSEEKKSSGFFGLFKKD
ncbi:MAG: hypothetical protein R3318_00905 [Gammaproteobacteria bacterium]|nr:hypothetical protein [Gammaproteobacteria bacterium]